MSKPPVIVLDQALVKSAVWLQLSGTAKSVFLIFRCKCQIEKIKGKPNKRRRVIVNNGEIVFTYKEAQEKYGISAASFRTAIDQLIERGFIDVTVTGAGYRKMTTLYAISDRWRQYGTDGFRTAKRPRSKGNPGFKKGNKLWQRRQK